MKVKADETIEILSSSDEEYDMVEISNSDDNTTENQNNLPTFGTEVYTDHVQLLNDIHPEFLEVVEPINSGLMDHLRVDSLFSSEEEQQVKSQTTRRDKARAAFNLLPNMSANTFGKICYPFLQKKYPHVLTGKTFHCENERKTEEEGCVKHLIKERIRLKRFADLFPSCFGGRLKEYNMLAEEKESEEGWDQAFSLCGKVEKRAHFLEMLQTLLQRFGIAVPSDLADLASKGFPCTCSGPSTSKHMAKEKPPLRKRRGVENVLQFVASKRWKASMSENSQDSSCGYPASSSHDGLSQSVGSNLSANSQDTILYTCEADDVDHNFRSTEDMESAMQTLEKINTAIYKASKVRPLFKRLESIKEELSVLHKMHQQGHPANPKRLSLPALQNRRKRLNALFSTIISSLSDASEIRQTYNNVQNSMHVKRWHVLVNEIKEADPFVESARRIYVETRDTFVAIRDKITGNKEKTAGEGTSLLD